MTSASLGGPVYNNYYKVNYKFSFYVNIVHSKTTPDTWHQKQKLTKIAKSTFHTIPNKANICDHDFPISQN